jgi:hypothetical protein
MDYDYWLRVAESHRVVFIPEFLANFRIHRSAKSTMYPLRSLRELRRVRCRYGPGTISWFYPRQLYRLMKLLVS